ncbi:MAG: proton-conducting transporter membrane subunit [Prosthecobacter sp.]|uniref:proton-conducting transporter transmembrane domain-containing protein n=1 Tax=Prosthecobacter sp. TaxID=1965333 RepID=UPI0039010DB3
MDFLSLPFITIGLASLLGGALLSWRAKNPRPVAIASSLITLLSFLLAAREVAAAGHARLFDPLLRCFEADALDAMPMAFYAALTFIVLLLAPKRDAGGRALAGMLLISASTQTAYAAANLATLAAGWWLTSVPFAFGMFGPQRGQKVTQVFLAASCIALTAGIILMHTVEINEISHTGKLAFGLLMLAVFLRKGLFPLHGWMVHAFEHGPLLPTALMFNGHLGALLVARAEGTALPETAQHALDILGMAALATALVTSLRAFAEKKPRRLLARLCVSQACFILVGLSTVDDKGITGGLLHWMVVAVATTGLVCILRALEVRISGVADPAGHLGLAVKVPRFATFFFVCGFALIGLPGTLGYCAEDLIYHGTLENHSWLGLALLFTTAFNAINFMRLFGLLFLGVLPKHVIDIPDALPRERWPLAACMMFLILGGLFPSTIIRWRAEAASVIESALGGGQQHE